MFHTIEFTFDSLLDLEVGRRKPLERVLIRRGTRRRAQIRPYVAEEAGELVEMADLYFEDGTVARRVSFACFFFAP
jgi:hypothetical protein